MTNHDRRNTHRGSVGNDGKSTVMEIFRGKLKDQVRNYQHLTWCVVAAAWWQLSLLKLHFRSQHGNLRKKRAASVISSSSYAMFSCSCHENLDILNGLTSVVYPLVDSSSNTQSSEASVQTVLLTVQPVVYVIVWLKSTYSISWAWGSWEYAFPVYYA